MLCISWVCAQTILDKKEIQVKLDEVQQHIAAENYEVAMNIIKSPTEVIDFENVPKKYIEIYNSAKSLLTAKEKDFNATQLLVDNYEKKYDAQDFCKAIEFLNLEFTKTNSFEYTQRMVQSLRPKYERAKTKCDGSTDQIKEWKAIYNQGNYEELFYLIDLDKTEQQFMYNDDFKRLLDVKGKHDDSENSL